MRGNAKFPATSSMMLIWHVYKPGANRSSRHFELKQRSLAIAGVNHRPDNDGRFHHLHLAPVEGQARPERRPFTGLHGGVIDLVVEKQFLVATDDMGQVGEQLHAVAHQRVVGPALRRRL